MEAEFKKTWEGFFAERRKIIAMSDEQALSYEKYALANRQRTNELMESLLQRLHMDLRGRRVLDIGSAYGGFPIVAARLGAEAYGVEIIDYLHTLGEANALDEPGLIKLINADILDREATAALGGTPFDLIAIDGVFASLYDSTAIFRRIAELSNEATVVSFTIPNGDCWQSIEKGAQKPIFGLTLLDPGTRSDTFGTANLYYRPLSLYQLHFSSVGFRHIYLKINDELVRTSVERVREKFAAIEQRLLEGPFPSHELNQAARHRFTLLRQQFAEDLHNKTPLEIHLTYDHYVWEGFASRAAVPTLCSCSNLAQLTCQPPRIGAAAMPVTAAPPEKKRLVITIDVEAFPGVQSEDFVNRLIWGKFGEHEVGIRRMMEVADKYGHKLTFFVDFCETFHYPGEFEKISREIVERGHDLQLHAHMDQLPEEFWAKHNLRKWSESLSDLTREKATILLDFLLDSAYKMGNGCRPVAFRGGSFRYNNELLKEMKRKGIDLSFDYNTLSQHQTNNEHNLPFFRWDNDVCEFPLATLYFRNMIRPLDFNELYNFADSQVSYEFIDRYYRALPENSVAVMIMHSWSFCYTDPETRFKVYRDDKLVQNFDAFLANLPADIEVVTAADLHRLVKTGELSTEMVRDVELTDKQKYRGRML